MRLLIDVTYEAVLVLAAVAFVRYREDGRSLLFPLLVLVAWTVGHIVFFGEPRYHPPALAVLAPLAGATLSRLWPEPAAS